MTLEKAREKAEEACAVLTAGLDPSSERRQTREAHVQAAQAERRALSGQPQEGSFECVARRWFAVKESQWMENYSSKVIRRLELHAFPKFGRKLLQDISPNIVLDACRTVEARDTLETAHRLREHQLISFPVCDCRGC